MLTPLLSAASGLYYLSELVEEHTVVAKKLLTRLIYSVIVLQFLLLVVDRFPLWLSLLSIASHAIYLQNLRYFPIVKLSDPVFIVSCRTSFLSLSCRLSSAILRFTFQSSPATTTTTTKLTSPLPG